MVIGSGEGWRVAQVPYPLLKVPACDAKRGEGGEWALATTTARARAHAGRPAEWEQMYGHFFSTRERLLYVLCIIYTWWWYKGPNAAAAKHFMRLGLKAPAHQERTASLTLKMAHGVPLCPHQLWETMMMNSSIYLTKERNKKKCRRLIHYTSIVALHYRQPAHYPYHYY